MGARDLLAEYREPVRMSSPVDPVPFPVTSRAALALRLTPEEVARLTKPEREERVRKLIGYSQWLLHRAKVKHLGRRQLAGTAVLYSGGNDSTTVAHLFRGEATVAIHANTGIGVEKTRVFVRNTCARWGLPLLEKSPRAGDTFRDMVLDRGFPGPAQHFKMYQRLKERCLRQARKELVTNGYRQRVIFLAGRRRSESARRADVPAGERVDSVIWVSPMVLWTKLDLNTYRLMAGDVPVNEVSELIHMSGECLCGSFAEKYELEMIGDYFPDWRDEIEALEAEIADRDDIPEIRRKWGWGAYRNDAAALKARSRSGPMCASCAGRAHGGEVVAA
ncbi:phosphoadenosine phosphosulfate reductase domain-containing protein [Streptomyces sp. enrichment culture]|uniref:phosphoadenosine phosphosulfate reductase domain-containing protein n=1 Tax=Streptomyces sp. enrichment culture TaxID=1795815 RepID=UPI003F574E5C